MPIIKMLPENHTPNKDVKLLELLVLVASSEPGHYLYVGQTHEQAYAAFGYAEGRFEDMNVFSKSHTSNGNTYIETMGSKIWFFCKTRNETRGRAFDGIFVEDAHLMTDEDKAIIYPMSTGWVYCIEDKQVL